MNELINLNRGYIHKLVIFHYTKYHKLCEIEDLKQECIMGFMDAVNRFDFDKNVTLLTYADLWMRYYMFTFYSKSTAVHVPAYLLRKILSPKTTEEAVHLNEALDAMKIISYDAFYSSDSKDVIVGNLALSPDTTTILFERHHIPLDFERAFDAMTPLQRDVINYVYLNYKISEISEMLEVTRYRVDRALMKAKQIIREYLTQNTHVPEALYEAA